MASISAAAPQFLVDRLDDALAFYERRLGFERDFVYEGFYAGVSRDGAVFHLKCAPKLQAERAHRRSEEHLDAFLAVSGIRELHDEFVVAAPPSTSHSSIGPGASSTSTSRTRTDISSAFRRRSDHRGAACAPRLREATRP
jgi:hypothetical protein